MITPPVSCIIDASVLVKLVLVEPDSPKAHELFAHLVGDPAARFHAPDFCYLECANILWKRVKQGIFPVPVARGHLTTLTGLPLQVIPLASLVDDALSLAATHDITAYDAAYVAASARFSVPLITGDEKLRQKLIHTPFQILLLSTVVIPVVPPPATP